MRFAALTSLLLLIAANAHATPQELASQYQAIRAEATALAGEPGAIPQRAVFLHEIYEDSKGSHTFPQVALHGALWGDGFFAETGGIGEEIFRHYYRNPKEREYRLGMLRDFATRFKTINRQVFIDTYTNYYFTKAHGEEAGAEELVPPELLAALNSMHAAIREGLAFSYTQRAELFAKALYWEQERSVGPMVQEAVAQFNFPILRRLVLKPIVRFSYFPKGIRFFFRDFSNKQERIEKATRAYTLAEQVGWSEVVRSTADYKILPDRYFSDPASYAREIREQLLR